MTHSMHRMPLQEVLNIVELEVVLEIIECYESINAIIELYRRKN